MARELGEVREDDDVIDDDVLEDEVLSTKRRGIKGSDELEDLEAEEMVIMNIIKQVEVIPCLLCLMWVATFLKYILS